MTVGSAEKTRERGRPRGTATADRRILAGALEVFAEHGLHGSTVEKIIAAAGVSRPTFYRTFRNKEEVFDAIVERGLRDIDLILADAITEADNLETENEKVAFVLRKYLQACFVSGPMIEIVKQVDYMRPELKDKREASTQRVRNLLSDTVRAAGYSEPDPLMLEGLMAAIERVVYMAYREHPDSTRRFERAWKILEPMSTSFADLVR